MFFCANERRFQPIEICNTKDYSSSIIFSDMNLFGAGKTLAPTPLAAKVQLWGFSSTQITLNLFLMSHQPSSGWGALALGLVHNTGAATKNPNHDGTSPPCLLATVGGLSQRKNTSDHPGQEHHLRSAHRLRAPSPKDHQ